MPAFSSGNVAVFKMDVTEGAVAVTDISQYIQSVKLDQDKKAQKLPIIGGNGVKKMVGPTDNTVEVKGWYHPTVVAAFSSYMSDTTPTTRKIEYGPQGTTAGNDKVTGNVFIVKFAPDTDAENPASFTATLEVDG